MPAGLPLSLPTAYVAAVTQFTSDSMKFEMRKDVYNALAAFIRSSPRLLSQADIGNQKKSFERPVQIPVIKRIGISLVDGRICNLTGQEASTDMVVITFSTKGFRFQVPTEMLEQNYIKYVDLLAQLLYDSWHAWYAFMEINSINYLAANKTSVLIANPYFTTAANAYVGKIGVDYYAAVRYVQSLNLLSANGQLLDVTSGASAVTKLKMMQYGPNNQTNEAMLIGGSDSFPSNFLLPDATYAETHYLFPVGAVGIYYWLSPNAAREHVHIQNQDYWWNEKDPMFGYFDTSVHYQSKCAEQSIGTNGAVEPVYYDVYEYTIDPSFVKSYSSVIGQTPIIKYNLTAV